MPPLPARSKASSNHPAVIAGNCPALARAVLISSRTSGSFSLASRECRALRASFVAICPNAQAAAPRTTAELSHKPRHKAGTARGSLRLPSTMAALRSNPSRLARHRAVPAKCWRNCSSLHSNHAVKSGAASSGRTCSSGSDPGGALRFQGQIS
jgi:hypothetical protein